MQSTIYHLQNQLKEAKDALQKAKEESPAKVESNNVARSADQVNSKDESSGDKEIVVESNESQPEQGELATNLDCESKDSNNLNSPNNCTVESSDAPEPTGDSKTSNGSQENHENLVKPEEAVKNGEQKVEERNSLERKRSLDEALEEVNASGNSECGIDSIIKKHRKLEQEKTQQD